MAERRLQGLHHRFDSGRRLQFLAWKWALSTLRCAPISLRIDSAADILDAASMAWAFLPSSCADPTARQSI
jgi:hypothetical protein